MGSYGASEYHDGGWEWGWILLIVKLEPATDETNLRSLHTVVMPRFCIRA